MSTLAHVFEAAGLATVALGSIKNQIVNTAPPRGLFCDFPLWRPLGKPNDPDFQHQVLAHAFDLVERATEPIVEEFPIVIADESEMLACPLPPHDDPTAHPAVAEARGLRAAYERAIARHGDQMGAFRSIGPDDVPAAIEAFARVADGGPWKEAGIPGIPARVTHDIRCYYETAAVALADHTPAAFAATRWFLHSTSAGEVIKNARLEMERQEAKQPIWYYMIPLGI